MKLAALLLVAAALAGQYLPMGARTVFVTSTCTPATGYAHCLVLTIDHTQVPNTDQSNFPVLVSATVANWKTSGNGGQIQNTTTQTTCSASGQTVPADLIFTSDSAGSTQITGVDWESYTATTGAVIFWIKIGTVSHTADTLFYASYNKSSVTTCQGTATGAWDSNYVAVYHWPDGSTLSLLDSTSNAHTVTKNGTVSAASGKIDGAFSIAGGSNNDLDPGSTLTSDTTAITWEAWATPSTGTVLTNDAIMSRGDDSSSNGWNVSLNAHNGNVAVFQIVNSTPAQVDLSATTTLSSATTYHFAGIWNPGVGMKIYINGTQEGTNNDTSSTLRSSGIGTRFGIHNGGGSYNGTIDEIRVSNTARGPDWLKTGYNNQNSPSTFVTIGSQQ